MKKLLAAFGLIAALATTAHAQVISTPASLGAAGSACTVNAVNLVTNCVLVNIGGAASTGIYVNVGASGTIQFEASVDATAVDNGTWFAVGDDLNGDTSTTTDGVFFFSNPGWRLMRVRASAISGTTVVTAVKGFAGLKSTATLGDLTLDNADGKVIGADGSTELTVTAIGSNNAAAMFIVDGSGNQITSFGGGTQFAEDAVHSSGAIGTLALVIRKDTSAASSDTDGDYDALHVGSTGRLWVDGSGVNLTVVNSGTFATQVDGAALTSLQLIDDAVFAEDAAHSSGDKGFQVFSVRRDSAAATATTDGDYQPLTTDSSGRLWVNVGSSVAVTNGGTFVVQENGAALTALQLIDNLVLAEDAVHNSGDPGIQALAKRADSPSATAADGDYTPLLTDANGRLHVLFGNTTIAATNAGTFVVQENGAALTALQLIDNIVGVEDAVAGSGYSGVPVLYVRQDSQTALAADGDFLSPTIDSAGGVRVSIVAGSSSGALADDADFTDGTTSGIPVGGVAEAASPSTVTEGDFGWFAMTLNRALKITPFTSTGTEITYATPGTLDAALGTTGIMFQGRGSTATPTAMSADNDVTAIWLDLNGRVHIKGEATEDLASANLDPGIVTFAIRDDTLDARSGTEGDYEPLHLNANGALWVIDVNSASALTALQLIDNAVNTQASSVGTGGYQIFGEAKDFDAGALPNVVTEGQATRPALTLSGGMFAFLTNEAGTVELGVQHDGVDTGYLVGLGYRAIAHGTNPTAVAAADRTVGYANRAGVPFVIGGHPNVITEVARVLDADGAQTNAALVTVGAGVKIVVTRVAIKCSNANSVDVSATVGFGTATLPAHTAAGTVGLIADFPGIAPGGGSVEGGGAGMLAVGADNEDLRLTMDDPVSGACSISYSYYTIES